MKKYFNFLFAFGLCLSPIFSQETLSPEPKKYGHLVVEILDVNNTVIKGEGDQLINKDEELTAVFENFKVFSYKFAYPQAKNEYLHKFATIECRCDVKELADYLEENYSTHFSYFGYLKEEDKLIPNYVPSDSMWYQTNPDGTPVLWHLKKIQADKAWNITKGSSNITIGIMDGGFDVTHPDLVNKVVTPYDSRTGDTFTIPNTKSYHGTTVASFAAAETDGGGLLASVGFNTMLRFYDINTISLVKIINIAWHASFVDSVNVINFSWLGTTSADSVTRLLVKEILDNNTVIVRSAGNWSQGLSDNDLYPFAYDVDDRIIIVSSTDKNDNHTNPNGETHSNYPEVSICAPGYSIMGATRYDSGLNPAPYSITEGTLLLQHQ